MCTARVPSLLSTCVRLSLLHSVYLQPPKVTLLLLSAIIKNPPSLPYHLLVLPFFLYLTRFRGFLLLLITSLLPYLCYHYSLDITSPLFRASYLLILLFRISCKPPLGGVLNPNSGLGYGPPASFLPSSPLGLFYVLQRLLPGERVHRCLGY